MEQDKNEHTSIRELQYMLDQLSLRHPQLPRLARTGQFDELTLEAVMIFQRDSDLPVTGRVDQNTWYAVTGAFREDQLRHAAPSSLRVMPHGEFSIPEGQTGTPLPVAQALLCALSGPLSNFRPCHNDTVNEGATRENLRQVQHLAGLEQTGTLDRITWEYLIRLYHAFVLRSPQPNE